MKRVIRTILALLPGVVSVLIGTAVPGQQIPAAGPPRKVVVGSLMYSMWGPYPGLAKRLDVLSSFIDAMSKAARQKYHTGLDIAVLPEAAVTGEVRARPRTPPCPWRERFWIRWALLPGGTRRMWWCRSTWRKTRRRPSCTTPAYCWIARAKSPASTAKSIPSLADRADQLEGGVLPGKDFPVFTCDFGKVGLQICYDVFFDDGWESLARKGAELVIWPTQSPQIIGAQCRAHRYHYYVVSSTWRNNISLVDPTGAVIAQQTKATGPAGRAN